MQSITIAQLGCGYWGPNLLRNFSSLSDCRVKWVAELQESRRKYVEQNFPKTQATDQWRTVLEDPEVQAVVIATTASSHYELTRQVLLAGKHAFVEKPMAMAKHEALNLQELAEQKRLVLMVGHTFLFNPAVRRLKELLSTGEIGDPYYIYCQRLNMGQVRSDVNVWWNLAPHDLSILLYLMDGQMPTSISAQGMDFLQTGIEDVAFVVLKWENRMTAHIHLSWLDPGKVRKVTVVGSKKMVVYDDVADDKITIFNKGVDKVPLIGERMDYDQSPKYRLSPRAGDILIPKIAFQEPLAIEAAHFLECIRKHEVPLTGPGHAVQVVELLEAGQAALKDQRTVVLQDKSAVKRGSSVRA